MLKWIPKPAKQLEFDQDTARSLYQKRKFGLIGILLLGVFLVFLFSSNSVPAIITAFTMASLFIFFYIRWRSFFLSYWYSYTYRSNSAYYEDYSWKDSLIIVLILIVGTGLCGLVIFYIASKVDFTSFKSFAEGLKRLI